MKLEKLKNFKSEEIFHLVAYLEKFANDSEDKQQFVLNHLQNFFPSLTFEQKVFLHNIIVCNDKKAMEDFIFVNPDIDVNLDGDSIIPSENTDGIQAKEKSLIMIYELLIKKDHLNKHQRQIIKAYELTCLKHMNAEEKDYNLLKFKILKKEKDIDQLKNINKYEKIKLINIKKFLIKVYEYCLNNDASTFLKYVLYYLDIIRLNPKSELSKNYIENINKIL